MITRLIGRHVAALAAVGLATALGAAPAHAAQVTLVSYPVSAYEAGTHEPMTGAVATLRDGQRVVSSCTIADTGTCQLPWFPEGSYQLVVSPADANHPAVYWPTGSTVDDGQTMQITEQNGDPWMSVEVPRAANHELGSISVRLSFRGKRPDTAQVYLQDSMGRQVAALTSRDRSGRVTIKPLVEGTYFLSAAAEGYLPAAFGGQRGAPITVQGGQSTDISLTLRPVPGKPTTTAPRPLTPKARAALAGALLKLAARRR